MLTGAVALLQCVAACAVASRIVGGEVADIAEFPFLTSLQRRGGGHRCVANVVTWRWLLTAAHCVCRRASCHPKKYVVVAGVSNLTHPDKQEKGQRGWPDRIKVHPLYSFGGAHDYDLAVLRLRDALVQSPEVDQVPLPADIVPNHLLYSESCAVAGWGHTQKDPRAAGCQLFAAADEGAAATSGYVQLLDEDVPCARVRAPLHARRRQGRLPGRLRGGAHVSGRTGWRRLLGLRLRHRVPGRVRARRHADGLAQAGHLRRGHRRPGRRLLAARRRHRLGVTLPRATLPTTVGPGPRSPLVPRRRARARAR